MVRTLFFFIIVCCFMLLSSCYKDLDVPNDAYQPRMVLAGVLVPGRPVVVRLTSNLSLDDTTNASPIAGAQVSLYRADEPIGEFSYIDTGAYSNTGVYSLAVPLSQGDTYTLRASHPGYPSIEATTTIPVAHDYDFNFTAGPAEAGADFKAKFSLLLNSSSNPAYYGVFLWGYNYHDASPRYDSTFLVKRHTSYPLSTDYEIDFFNSSGFWFHDDYDLKCERFEDTWEGADIWPPVEPDPDEQAEADSVYLDCLKSSYIPKPNDFLHPMFALTLTGVAGFNDEFNDNFRFCFFSNEPNGQLDVFFESMNKLNVMHGHHYFFNIYHLSPELYKAFSGLAAQEATKAKLFVTPIATYNSIRNGIGYFGSCLVDTISFNHYGEWQVVSGDKNSLRQ